MRANRETGSATQEDSSSLKAVLEYIKLGLRSLDEMVLNLPDESLAIMARRRLVNEGYNAIVRVEAKYTESPIGAYLAQKKYYLIAKNLIDKR